MATPQMILQRQNATIYAGNPAAFFFPTLDPQGNPIDVHTGYTAPSIKFTPSASSNPQVTGQDLSSLFVPSFSATGVTLTLNTAHAQSLFQTIPVLQGNVDLFVSNDGATTVTFLGRLTIALDMASYQTA